MIKFQQKRPGAWLPAAPTFSSGTISSSIEFRDELRDHYSLKLFNVLYFCDGCGYKHIELHELIYKVGGLARSCCDQNRDSMESLACSGFQLANAHDEHMVNLCRNLIGLAPSTNRI